MATKTLFHSLVSFHYFFGVWYDQIYVDVSIVHFDNDIKFLRGRLKFLTMWNVLLQAVFFTICAINDVIGTDEDSPKRSPAIRRLKDLILPCLAFPLSMFVGLTFWGLYFVDRELILPRALDQFFPLWLNHIMHTNIMIFILVETYISHRTYPPRRLGLAVLSAFMLTYLVWIHVIHAYTGIWVYPVLQVLNLPLRVVFFLALLALAVLLYVAGEKLNALIWRKPVAARKSR